MTSIRKYSGIRQVAPPCLANARPTAAAARSPNWIPLGSGAIESSIRRVINLRLKGNGIFWRAPQAEAMLQVRAQVISNRWDQRLSAVRALNLHDGQPDWMWEPRSMSIKLEPTDAAPA